MENRTPLDRVMQKAEKYINETIRNFQYVRDFLKAGMIDNANTAAFNLAHTSERLTLLTREIPCCTGNPHARVEIDKILEEEIPVKIGYTKEGWFCAVLPSLLPKKEQGSAEYIQRFLYPGMQRFFSKKVPVYYPHCTIIYRHVYDKSRPEREFRDHDNIETYMVTDIVALFVMNDDSAMRCSHHYCSAKGKENRTEVYVVHSSEFMDWYMKEKSYPIDGIELLSDYP